MAYWYPLDQQMLQQQQQQQLGPHSAFAYSALPHLACLPPSPYPPVQYAYSSTPVAVNGMQPVWVPWKVACDPAPYSHYGQIHLPHSGQQMPYRDCRRPASARSSYHSDPMQMAWPESPTAAQSFGHHQQQRFADGATPRQQISRRASVNCIAVPSQPLLPARNLQCSQQPSNALSDHLAPLSLCDNSVSSNSTAFPGGPDVGITSSTAEHHASSGSITSAEDIPSAGRAVHSTQCSMDAAAEDEHAVDGMGPAWQWLTLGLLRDIMAELPPHCRKRCRLVCKRWRTTMDVTVQELAPKHAQIHATLDLFPGLTALDLSGCQNVRNRNLAILSRSRLKMQSLSIGHVSTTSYGKPRITNQALQSIAAFKGLQKLVLADCSAVTTGGLQQLSGLIGLHHLALLRCPRVGDRGMTLLHCLTCLTYLALTGCTKVADGSMQCVSAVPNLRALVLGHTRVQDTGLAMLAASSALTHVTFTAEAITNAGLLALGELAGLQKLEVSQCNGVTEEGLLEGMPCWPALTHLHLDCLRFTTESVCTLVQVAPQLGHLVVQGTPLKSVSLGDLAALPSLRSLSVCVSPNDPYSLTALTCLPHLTALQVPCHAIAMAPSLGYCIGQLSALQGLDVHGFEGSIAVYASHGQPPALLSFTCCHQLQWLDISHWAVTEPEVSRLLARLPALQHLCLLGCPISEPELASLEANFPRVSFHKLPKGALWLMQTA
ncbi:hypothetical protein ABBQ32_001921 [Trebouxia sp. C0010 RCD-2024]